MVLEALACEVPVIVRRISVYEDWLREGGHVCKASDTGEFRDRLEKIFSGDCSGMREKGRALAEEHSLYRTGLRLGELY